jgi:hypothetical protein
MKNFFIKASRIIGKFFLVILSIVLVMFDRMIMIPVIWVELPSIKDMKDIEFFRNEVLKRQRKVWTFIAAIALIFLLIKLIMYFFTL